MIGIRDIQSDAKLPQLPEVLDASVMKEMFQANLFNQQEGDKHFTITECEVVYVSYKPHKPCTVCYQLIIHDGCTNRVDAQLQSARIFEVGQSLSRFHKAQTLPLTQPEYGKAVLHIPELGMVSWSFPNDRKLEALPKLLDMGILQKELLPIVLERLGEQKTYVWDVSFEMMNFVPRYSCTVKIVVQFGDSETSGKKTLTLFAKNYADPNRAERAYVSMRKLWETNERQTGKFSMAQPVWFDPKHGIFWQLAVPGKTLLQCDMQSDDFAVWLRQAGRLVGTLHGISVSGVRSTELRKLVRRLQENKMATSQLSPKVINAFKTTIGQLVKQVNQFPEFPSTTLHGDLHLKNMIVNGATITIIDLDDIGKGSPLFDVGSFVSFLLYQGLEMGMSQPQIDNLIAAFLQGYCSQSGRIISEPHLRWHVVAALIDERVMRCLKKAKPGTVPQVERLVQAAERLVSGIQRLPVDMPGNEVTSILAENRV